MTAQVEIVDPLLGAEGAAELVGLAEAFGAYGLYAAERNASSFAPGLFERIDTVRSFLRTGGRTGDGGTPEQLLARTSYFREAYAYGDDVAAPGIEAFRTHEELFAIARRLHDRPIIEPAIVYANILLAGQELTVHTDVPEFRGANRKVMPQWLVVVMHHSGLFERWRLPITTAIAYVHPEGRGCQGGDLAYYPEGPEGPATTYATRNDTAVVLDTDSVFHGVDRVGPPGAEPPRLRSGSTLTFADDRWWLHDPDHDGPVADLGWEDLRYSVSWKAYAFTDEAERAAWRTHSDDLDLPTVLGRLRLDLHDRGVLAVDAEIGDDDLGLLLIDTYVHFPSSLGQPDNG